MKPIEQKRTGKAAMERTFFEDLDRAAIERLEETYGDSVSAETFERMKDLPSSFESRKEFEKSYAEVAGKKPDPEVWGFSTGLEGPAHIRADELGAVPKTVIHESMHQLSHPEAANLLGKPLYEGITEDMAARAGELQSSELQGYPGETRAAREIIERCGEEAVKKAYFEGNGSELLKRVEDNLKERASENLKPDLEKNDG